MNPVHTFPYYFPKIHSNFIFTFKALFHVVRDSSVGIALGYGLDDRGSRIRFLERAGNFSLHHRVQNGSGAHPASYPMGIRCSFPGGKAAGAWSWPLTSIWCRGQRMSRAIPSLPQYTCMAWCSVLKSTGTTLPLSLPFRFSDPKFCTYLLTLHAVGNYFPCISLNINFNLSNKISTEVVSLNEIYILRYVTYECSYK
jgi:hypothetical protein